MQTNHLFSFIFFRLLGLAWLACLSITPALAQIAVNQTEEATPSEIADTPQTRYFQEVHDAKYPGAYQVLSRLGYNGDFILLVETDAARTPISDTLLVWIQHHGPEQPLAKQAEWADLIISCYPEHLPATLRNRHALPEAQGKVWLYFVEGRHLLITDQRQPALDFALKTTF